jgi:hypothetical protein
VDLRDRFPDRHRGVDPLQVLRRQVRHQDVGHQNQDVLHPDRQGVVHQDHLDVGHQGRHRDVHQGQDECQDRAYYQDQDVSRGQDGTQRVRRGEIREQHVVQEEAE